MRVLMLSFLCAFSLAVFGQQNVQVKGKVVAEDGTPLPGASVFVDNSTIGEKSNVVGVVTNYNMGTVANEHGQFSLSVPKNVERLTCSFIGYTTQAVSIRGKSFITFVMKESEGSMLQNVVVTGYQKIEKRKLTSAISTLGAGDILQAGVPSIDIMLSGQVAGVQTTALSGAPGAPAKIRIRGTASLNGTQDPL